MTLDTENYNIATELTLEGISGLSSHPSQRPNVRSLAGLRQQARETTDAIVILDTIFGSKTSTEVANRLSDLVWSTKQFTSMALHRRRYLEGFVRGVEEAVARFCGTPSALSRPAGADRAPDRIRSLQEDAIWHKHPNGGGWVSHTAFVEPSVYVGPTAVVFDRARLAESVRVLGNARIGDDCEISGRVRVKAQAYVGGEACLGGGVVVAGAAIVIGRVRACGSEVFRDQSDVAKVALPDRVLSTRPSDVARTFFEQLRPPTHARQP